MKSSELVRRYGIEALIPKLRAAMSRVVEERYRQAVADVPFDPDILTMHVLHSLTDDRRQWLVDLAVHALRELEELEAEPNG